MLGNYLNLAHPDTDALHAIQEKYYAHIRFASLLGCGMVGTGDRCNRNAEYKFCPGPQRCCPCHLYHKLQAGGALRAVRRDHCH